MVIAISAASLFILFLIISTIRDHIKTNKIIEESEKSMERTDMRISELLKKERKYDAIYKYRKYKLPNGAYGRK